MKASILPVQGVRVDYINDRSLGIQYNGSFNDYPQRVCEAVYASVTGKSCYLNYSKFIAGKGFADTLLYKQPTDNNGGTYDALLKNLSDDLALYGGFAVHLNYNANHFITTLTHIPFEHVRFEKMDDEGVFKRVALHPDWGHRYTNLRRWRKQDIVFIDLYNPNADAIDEQVAEVGGWQNYKGQVFVYSNEGCGVYPIPVFDNALTDMNTEEAISDITNRNATRGFLPAGFLVEIINKEPALNDNEPSDVEKVIKQMQGSRNANKVGYLQVNSKEEIPEFLKMSGVNYDKEFTVSRTAAMDSIGRAFMQPPILRSEDVGSNFGSELMEQAYKFYNSVTQSERLVLERAFVELVGHTQSPVTLNCEILPLTYESGVALVDRLGKENTALLMQILSGAGTLEQKKATIKTLFNLSDMEVNSLVL